MSQEEVIAPRASALQLVVASWQVLDVGKSGLFSPTVSTELVVCGQRQKLLQHSWLPISTNAFRENPFVRSFIRPSIHPSKQTLLAFAISLGAAVYISSASQPRTASVYCCHLLSAAFCLRSQDHSTRSSTHGPRPTGHGRPHGHGHRGCRMFVDPKLNGAHPGSLAASRVRGALVIGAWWWLFSRLATSTVSHLLAPFSVKSKSIMRPTRCLFLASRQSAV
jgi:hypothetical protein